MAKIETWIRQDMDDFVNVVQLRGGIYQDDEGGNLIGVELYKGGEPYSPGGTVSALITPPDGETFEEAGSLDGNRASVVLPADAYALRGQEKIIIKLTQGDDVTTIGSFVVTVF